VYSEKSIGAVLAETKEELKNFVQTRLAILKAELADKIKSWKAVIPLAITAALVLLTAFFAVTFTLVALLAGLLQPRPLAWFFGGAIVSLLYLSPLPGDRGCSWCHRHQPHQGRADGSHTHT
jgi:hypothetical protein